MALPVLLAIPSSFVRSLAPRSYSMHRCQHVCSLAGPEFTSLKPFRQVLVPGF